MNKIIKFSLISFLIAFVVMVGVMWAFNTKTPETALSGVEDSDLGYSNSQWFIVNKFSGYKTKYDASKLDNGANPNGQNTTANSGDRISIRNQGFEIFPDTATATTTTDGIKSIHTFRKRSGDNIMLRTYKTFIEYYSEENGKTWEYLKTGLTAGKTFDFADYNINTEQHSYVYFGNGTDDFMRWNGANTTLTSAVSIDEKTINATDTEDFADADSIIFCGTEQAYTSKTNTTFTLTASSTIACANGKGVAQIVNTDATNPKGNIYLNANNRLFISGIASTTQAVWFSTYGDPMTFTNAALVTDTTAESPGIFNLGEGGGGVEGMLLDEKSIYIFKKSIIYKATLSDSLYTLDALKPFDGKGQTIGGVHNQSIFSGGNGIFFITPDNQILFLTRVEQVDYPQVIPISDIIKPTMKDLDFSSSAGIVFRDKAYFSLKAESSDSYNNTIFVYNIKQNMWDSPIVGWNVSDFTIYDDGNGEELYFGNVIASDTFLVIDDALDNDYSVKANWRSKQFDFQIPHLLKQINNVYVEGYISPNTTLTISLLADEDGYTQTAKTEFAGTETDYIFDASEYNLFGLSKFGVNRFGTDDEESLKKKFRVYLGKSFRLDPCYNVQIDFASDDENQEWSVTNFGFKYRIFSQPEKSGLFRSFQ